MKKKTISIVIAVIIITAITLIIVFNNDKTNETDINENAGFENFITVDPKTNDKLLDGDKEFRFIGMNPQDFDPVWMIEYPSWNYAWDIPTDYELEDIIRTASQMGATVVRDYAISVGDTSVRHVQGPGVFSEESFKRLDKIFELCNKYKIRLILGLVDNWSTLGGIADYARWRDKEEAAFFTDPEIIADFKLTIDFVTERYKDEKALLCWETGNEFPINADTNAWTKEIAAYIKSKDPNHLVEDGHFGISKESLENPDIDIVNEHYYHWVQGTDYAKYCREGRALTKGKKVFIVEEFGYAGGDINIYHDLLTEVIDNGTSGAMIWAMAHRSENGGFYWHDGNNVHMGEFWTYHWPGFPSGSSYNEIETFELIREHAYELRGVEMPPLPVPDSPMLLPIDFVDTINWRGSTGATSYDVERAASINGPWTIVGSDISDGVKGYKALFDDKTAEEGTEYYYRVIAKNSSGISEPSNIVGPIKRGK